MTDNMSDPVARSSQATVPVSNAPVVLRIILAILLLIPGVIGIVVLGGLTGLWLYEGFQFSGPDRPWMPLFILPAVALVLFSVITVGIVLRFARWKAAPTASLVLAIVSAAAVVTGYQLMLDSLSSGEERFSILAIAIVALGVAAVPPLLHWWNAPVPISTPGN